MSQENVILKVKEYTKQHHCTLFSRCNTAILAALKIAKSLGYENAYIPDVAGWLTYEPYAKKAKLKPMKLVTDHGIINPKSLTLEPKSVIIYHTLAGYHTLQNSKEIVKKAHEQNAFVIEDVCGSLSIPAHGDIVVGSFGKAKPANFGAGGFAAANDAALAKQLELAQEPLTYDMTALFEKLTQVPARLTYLRALTQKTKGELQTLGFAPIADNHAIIIIVPYQTDEEKKKIELFCTEKDFEWEVCPRYIRSDKQAISIEIKRK